MMPRVHPWEAPIYTVEVPACYCAQYQGRHAHSPIDGRIYAIPDNSPFLILAVRGELPEGKYKWLGESEDDHV